MADVIDFEEQFKKVFDKKNAATQFNADTAFEQMMEDYSTGELITDFFDFVEVLKEMSAELELRGYEVVAVPGDDDDAFESLTVGIRQVA